MAMESHGNWEISVTKKWNINIYKYHHKNSDLNSNSRFNTNKILLYKIEE